jgi:hypothetical protein
MVHAGYVTPFSVFLRKFAEIGRPCLTYTNSNGHAKAAMSVASFINKIALKI